jgi:two-component system LytT family response regulator
VVIGARDPAVRASIAGALRRHSHPVVITTRTSGEGVINAIESNPPDIVFLDVQMGRSDAFDVIEAVGPGRLPPVVLIAMTPDARQRALDTLSPLHFRAPDARIMVRAGNRMMLIDPDEIDWVEAGHNYVRLHVASKSYRLRGTITELETSLGVGQFVRIHRGTLVRLGRIRELRLHPGWRCTAVLKSGVTLSVSRTYRTSLLRRLRGRRMRRTNSAT